MTFEMHKYIRTLFSLKFLLKSMFILLESLQMFACQAVCKGRFRAIGSKKQAASPATVHFFGAKMIYRRLHPIPPVSPFKLAT